VGGEGCLFRLEGWGAQVDDITFVLSEEEVAQVSSPDIPSRFPKPY
jgi:hypothetical protein